MAVPPPMEAASRRPPPAPSSQPPPHQLPMRPYHNPDLTFHTLSPQTPKFLIGERGSQSASTMLQSYNLNITRRDGRLIVESSYMGVLFATLWTATLIAMLVKEAGSDISLFLSSPFELGVSALLLGNWRFCNAPAQDRDLIRRARSRDHSDANDRRCVDLAHSSPCRQRDRRSGDTRVLEQRRQQRRVLSNHHAQGWQGCSTDP